MTTVPPRPAVPPGRGKRSNVKNYTAWEWIKGYAMWCVVLPIYFSLWAFALVFRRLPGPITKLLLDAHKSYTRDHAMDFRIPPDRSVGAYMLRWWRIPRNAFFNVYYHIVLRSDDDRALHDHPWWNFSIVLEGGYFEHTIAEGGVGTKVWYPAGSVKFRRAGTYAHRLELKRQTVADMPIKQFVEALTAGGEEQHIGNQVNVELPVRTIFITGPVLRRWGFHHPERWVDAYEWDDFNRERGVNDFMAMDGGSDAVQSSRNTI